MISKTKLAVLLALVTMGGIASPAFAKATAGTEWDAPAQAGRVIRNVDNPALTGGGSTAYNVNMQTDY